MPYANDEEQQIAEGVGGYARPMPPEWMARQAGIVDERVKEMDIVITTALIPGQAGAEAASRPRPSRR